MRRIAGWSEPGVLLMAEELKPLSQGKRVTFKGVDYTTFDGPFPQARELVAGFGLCEVKDMDDAFA